MKVNIFAEIERLVQYALKTGLIEPEDKAYSTNLIIETLGLDNFEMSDAKFSNSSLEEIMDNILDWAHEAKLIKSNSVVYRDLLDTKIMNCLLPRPSEVIKNFYGRYNSSPEAATEYFYSLCKNSNYIRTNRIARDMAWKTGTEFGELDITINLSKPEKDPIAIAEAKKLKASSYPKCLLCRENEGYPGRLNHPARQNLRLIPVELKGEKWFFQYSPYVYYNEHSIVLNELHKPMKIDRDTFEKLLEFVDKFPHYFIGSNAELPIVGGSILSHDHFQAGNYEFPMAKATVEYHLNFEKYSGVSVGLLKWPMSVIRLSGKNRKTILDMSSIIIEKWKEHDDESNDIISHTGDVPHNTITPIVRRKGELYEMDLVLRNNRTSDEHPLGIFHPHSEVHHIKKENIGLIEVMGLAVLPSRLKTEIEILSSYLTGEKEGIEREEALAKHLDWYHYLKDKYPKIHEEDVLEILKAEIGLKYLTVLEHAGVYKRNESSLDSFISFTESCFKP